MYRFAKIFSLTLLTFLFMLPLPVWAASAAPKIVFDKQELVFSDAKENQMLPAEFTFTNEGKINLVIDSITPSCGCATAEFTKVVEPGKKGIVKMTLDTTGITGAFRKTAVVSTNDPASPFVTLVMLGETQSKVKIDLGRRIDLVGCHGEDITTTATLTEIDGNPLILAGVDNPMSAYLDTELQQDPGGRSYKLKLRIKTDRPIDFAGPIYLVLPNRSKVSLYVVAEAKGPFTVRPQEVLFGSLVRNNQAASKARIIEVTRSCAEDLDISRLVYDAKKFKVEEDWLRPGQKVNLVVTPLVDQMPSGTFEEKFGIQMGDQIFNVMLKGNVN